MGSPSAVTDRCSLFFLGARTLESFREFGIPAAFAGVVVSDRYQNYTSPSETKMNVYAATWLRACVILNGQVAAKPRGGSGRLLAVVISGNAF